MYVTCPSGSSLRQETGLRFAELPVGVQLPVSLSPVVTVAAEDRSLSCWYLAEHWISHFSQALLHRVPPRDVAVMCP